MLFEIEIEIEAENESEMKLPLKGGGVRAMFAPIPKIKQPLTHFKYL
ncbi:hypothetical protein C8D94_101181 [Marinirhabdus gelatinilytica]|uniref:Uncharacterized protein n=1 Tax=Marinirhabdus gelatinilytica TaxID=1703343 RepID=A0A370QIY7_9FLAO|nr:hypothetical protein C8D94_101181 [Marinirhabdus gelatinilytica]